MLKKPQCISICQFVQCVEQLNSYISQLPCWYYSPSAKAGTITMNVAFPEADLAGHVLWMCPQKWQDQFNLHKKRLNPMDMHLLLQCLEARKLLRKVRKERRDLVRNLLTKFQRKLVPRSIVTCAKNMGAHIPAKQ